MSDQGHTIFARFPHDKGSEIRISLSGSPVPRAVHIRVWAVPRHGNELVPTNKGFWLVVSEVPGAIEALQKLLAAARAPEDRG